VRLDQVTPEVLTRDRPRNRVASFATFPASRKQRGSFWPATLSAELLGETSRVMVQAKIEKAIRKPLNEIADEGMNYPLRK
jgi:hypothetical protein